MAKCAGRNDEAEAWGLIAMRSLLSILQKKKRGGTLNMKKRLFVSVLVLAILLCGVVAYAKVTTTPNG